MKTCPEQKISLLSLYSIGLGDDMLPRFYCENIDVNCRITAAEARHITTVMRMQQGDTVELFDGFGGLAVAKITQIDKKKRISVEVKEFSRAKRRLDNRIVLAVSVAKGQRFDWFIAKATELGVDHICPVIYHRTVKQSGGVDVIERYRNIAIAASKQCKRLQLPFFYRPLALADFFEHFQTDYPKADLIISSLDSQAFNALDYPLLHSGNDKIVFVGPEGGFTTEEEQFLKNNGAACLTLTDTVLRTETAALAISAVLATARQQKCSNR